MANDVLLDENGDLWIDPETGDFKVGPSEEQEVSRIVPALPGHFRNNPVLAGKLPYHLKSNASKDTITKSIDTALRLDGFSKIEVAFDKTKLNVKASRDE